MAKNGKKALTEERRRRILEELKRRGAVRTLELARFFSVSPMTIRNDLAVLARRGLVERVHGGAMVKDTLAAEPSYYEKATRNLEEKKRIGGRLRSSSRKTWRCSSETVQPPWRSCGL
jgi:DeoR/GlpR family transcriptional regulator of sugar metabolism